MKMETMGDMYPLFETKLCWETCLSGQFFIIAYLQTNKEKKSQSQQGILYMQE